MSEGFRSEEMRETSDGRNANWCFGSNRYIYATKKKILKKVTQHVESRKKAPTLTFKSRVPIQSEREPVVPILPAHDLHDPPLPSSHNPSAWASMFFTL